VAIGTLGAGQGSIAPTNDVSGIETTDDASEAFNTLTDILCTGFKNGFLLGEHCVVNQIHAYVCANGFNLKSGGHSSWAGRICSQWCPVDIFVSAGANLCNWNIYQLDIEWMQTGQWYDNVYTISDSANRAKGSIFYTITVASVGLDNSKFVKNGATVINCYAGNAGLADLTKTTNTFSSAGATAIVLNTTLSTGSPGWYLQKSGVSKWSAFIDINATNTADFSIYDHANSKARIYFGTTGTVNIGGTATGASSSIISLDGTNTTNKLTVTSAGIMNIGGAANDGTLAAIAIGGSNNNIGFNNNAMYYNAVTNRLSIGSGTSPAKKLDITTSVAGAGDGVSITNSATTGFALVNMVNNAGDAAQIFKSGATVTAYKTLNVSDAGIYNGTVGNMSFLNDNTSGNINFAAGGVSSAQMTLSSAGSLSLANGNITLGTAGNKLVITEGTNGRVGQVALTSGVATVSISGLTSSSRAFMGFVAQGGTSTTVWQYKMVCTTGTLTITAIDVTGTTVTTDTSTVNYFIIN